MRKILFTAIVILVVFGIGVLLFQQQPENNKKDNLKVSVSAAVVPHHNIVANQRAKFFSDLAEKIGKNNYPKTIILISPNHYYAGQGKVQTTTQNWNLNEGSIHANEGIILGLVNANLAVNEPSSFVSEHGIYNILGDIHNTFPEAQLVPLIFENTTQAQLSKLEESLSKSCDQCLMIASVDFSHYEPAQLADLHDQKSIRDLQTLNTADLISNAEVDSGPALSLLAMWAKDHHTEHFNLQNHTDSDILLNNLDLEGTSHVFGWYETGDQVQPEKFISFVISANEHIGDEDRSIWGTDFAIYNDQIDGIDPNTTVVAGKLTLQDLEFFALPVDPKNPSRLLTSPEKHQIIDTLYLPYSKYRASDQAGDYIKIPYSGKLSGNFSIDNLSVDEIKSKIKLLTNLK